MPAPAPTTDGPRRRRLLDAALATFTRFGFRKTSMEEVARAAHMSRQGLYLHFETKEELFREVIRYAVETGLAAAAARVRDPELGIDAKLAAAFDEWIGRYVGMVGETITDLEEATGLFGCEIIKDHEARFLELIGKAIRASGLPAAYKTSGITARQLAETLHATARGLKHACATRAEFVERFGIAIRVVCLPLRERE